METPSIALTVNIKLPTKMAISGNATYIITADAVLSHWNLANTALGAAGPVLTAAGLNRAGLQTLRDGVESAFIATTSAINTVEITRSLLGTQKARICELIGAFNEAVRGRLANTTGMPAGLPAVPGPADSAATVISAASDTSDLWDNIDSLSPIPGFTPPLVLRVAPAGDPEGTPISLPLADFKTAADEIKALSTEFTAAERELNVTRDRRDIAKKQLYDGLRDYRAAIPGHFPAADPIRTSLPELTPPPGSTPAAVTAAAGWDAGLSQGKITFSASTAATLDHYELRHCPGAEYSTEDEITTASSPGTGPLEFLTLTGLAAPGATALFRVYVVTATGNESGSNTVSITRPA